MDIIFLHGLKVDCHIGAWEWERQITQSLIIDLDMGYDISKAASSDSLKDTLSYRDVAKRVESFVRGSQFSLIEPLVVEIADILMKEFGIQWCRVKVNKFGAVRGAGDVGVVIERGKISDASST